MLREEEVVEEVAKLAKEINRERKEHNASVVEVINNEAVVVTSGKLSSCAVMVCLMSSRSDFIRDRQTSVRKSRPQST